MTRFRRPDETVLEVLAMQTWAVVGWSPVRGRASNSVAAFLEARGRRVRRLRGGRFIT